MGGIMETLSWLAHMEEGLLKLGCAGTKQANKEQNWTTYSQLYVTWPGKVLPNRTLHLSDQHKTG